MKARLSLVVFLLLAAGFLVYLWSTQGQLPARVATHFDIHGRPNGWMSREGIVRFMAVFGLLAPLVVIAAFNSPRFVPIQFVNLPNRDYWLAEERREASLLWLSRMGTWFGSFMLLFMAAMHELVIRANQQGSPHLDAKPLWTVVGILIACTLRLIVRIVTHFSKPPLTTRYS
ncbi:hypothetical protein AYO49_04130 [Verrucomicrobiaceae bacterium SCGC AG-212-N21]|nr:hypothetical protein AYO49_04130 [Verrucomicrobiaceae bacterium SCGC AG-212-N21]